MDIKQLHPLIGTWKGEGVAQFPTIEVTPYTETLTVALDESGTQLQYEQKTWVRDTGDLLHWEFGFLQFTDDGALTLNNCQNNGRTEILKSTLVNMTDSGGQITLHSSAFANDPRMIKSQRIINVTATTLHYAMAMETNNVSPSANHLEAILKRQ